MIFGTSAFAITHMSPDIDTRRYYEEKSHWEGGWLKSAGSQTFVQTLRCKNILDSPESVISHHYNIE